MEEQAFPLSVKYERINTISINIPELDHVIQKGTNISFSLRADVNVVVKKNIIRVKLSVSASETDNENIVGEITTVSTFKVETLENLNTVDGKIEIPDGLIITLNSLAISSTRGILQAKSQGSILETTLIPIINPKELKLQESVKLDIDHNHK